MLDRKGWQNLESFCDSTGLDESSKHELLRTFMEPSVRVSYLGTSMGYQDWERIAEVIGLGGEDERR